MVLFLLYMKAELENVGTCALSTDVAGLRISVRNPLSDYEVRENVVVDPTEFLEQDESSREPPHHFRLTWEGGSKKASTLTVLTDAEAKADLKKKKKKGSDSLLPRSYAADDSGNWVPILAIECRGMEPYAFSPMGNSSSSDDGNRAGGTEFVVTSVDGAVFTEDVDLGEGDWSDYDVERDQPVSMSGIEFKFEAV